jgi:DNA-dependent protein kinase catalytic subunit
MLVDEENPGQQKTETMGKNNQSTTVATFVIFHKFINEVLVRTKQYKDELLGACLEFVLAAPKEFLVDLEVFLPSLFLAFKLGLSYLPLAHVAIDAVEYWWKVKRREIIPLLPKILPFMNEFLSLNKGGDDSNDIDDDETRQMVLGRAKRLTAKKISTKKAVEKLIAKNGTNPIATPRGQVQLRIVRLLAKLGGHNIHLIKVSFVQNLLHRFSGS